MATNIVLKRSASAGSAPSTSDLELGELALNTYDGKLYMKKTVSGSSSIVNLSGSTAASSSAFAHSTYKYTASSNQTTFTGSDANSVTLAYTAGQIQVFLNGILLDVTDYTASNGTSVVLGSGAGSGDILLVTSFEGTNPFDYFKYTATNGQTSFSGDDANSESLIYTTGNIQVYLNGVLLDASDYTATSGTSVVLGSGATTGDILTIWEFNEAGLSDLASDTSPQLGGDLDVVTYDIVSTSNRNIDIVPNGTGDVTLQTDTVQLGSSGENVTVTTSGTGDVTLNTNSGTNSGSIVIADGANNNITLTPNGTGIVSLAGDVTIADGSNDFDIASHDGTNGLKLGGTVVTTTAAELNTVDGSTSASSTTLAAADRIIVNDDGTMKQVALSDFETFFESALDTIANLEVTTELQTPLIAYTDGDDAITIADGGGITAAAGITSTAAANSFGATSFGDADITNVGDIQLDSITGDGDTNTAITFSGSDVITVSAGGDNQVTFTNGAIVPSTDNDIDLGTSGTEFKDAFFDGTVTSDAFAGPLTGDVTGNVSGSSGSTTGNAATATALANARTIGGTSFDGTANIAVGLAATATALASARTLGGVSFDGTANINLPGVNTSGSQDTSGTAAIATSITAAANNSTDETVYPTFVDGATGTQGLETDTGLTYNPSSGTLTSTVLVGALTGNVTGNVSGSAGSATGNAATATEATNVTASANNSTDETVYPTFVDGATGTQGIETDTGLTYNPSSGDLTTAGQLGGATLSLSGNATVGGNLTVTGTTTTVDTVTMNAQNAVVFEGATADGYETTLSVVDPTADHTQYLLNQGGYIPVLAASTTTAISSTPAELNLLDGSSANSVVNSKAVIYGSSGELAGTLSTAAQTNITSLGTLTALTVDNLGINGNTITANSGAVNITPAGGSAIVLDGTINVDAGVVTGATSITSTAFVGTLSTAAQTNITSLGTLTALTVDDITINGSTISDGADLTLDVVGNINLDADGGEWRFKDDGTLIGQLYNGGGGSFYINSTVSDKDLIFQGNDGGSTITALTLDMSAAGKATFNDVIKADGVELTNGSGAAGGTTPKLYSASSGVMAISANSAERLKIDGPNGRVQITGILRADNFTIGSDQGSDGQVMTSTGSGVAWEDAGSSGPTFKTFGTGSIMVGDSTTGTINAANYNTGLGIDVFASLTSGDENIAIGYRALDGGNPSYNIAIGNNALGAAATGSSNVAIGTGASGANTSGTFNVTVGHDAAALNETGTNNTAIGYLAMNANTNSSNTAVGSKAGNDLTGEGNVFIGKDAGEEATSCDYSVVIGANANGTGIMTGNNNVVIGSSSGAAMTSGHSNVAVGAQTLGTQTTQTSCTAIGFQAGASNTGGSNVFVGLKAGYGSHTADGNTLVGTECGMGITSGHSNVCVGKDTGRGVTTGYWNTYLGSNCATTGNGNANVGIGNQCLETGGHGDNNVAIGWSVGEDYTGTQGTFVGAESARQATSTDGSTTLGYNAMGEGITTGDYNTIIGAYSAKVITSGTMNQTLGAYAGGGITTGERNIAIGHKSMYKSSPNITGDHNICIGSDSHWAATYPGGSLTSGYNNTLIGNATGHWSVGITSGFNIVCVGGWTTASVGTGSNQTSIGYNLANQRGNNTVSFGNAGSWVGLDYGSTTVYSSSDERLKQDINPSSAGLSFINDLTPRTFKWKKRKDLPTTFQSYVEDGEEFAEDHYNNKSTTQLGFIAQEVKTVIDNHSELPDGFEMWSEQADSDSGEQQIGESALIPILVKSLQELSAKNDALEARILALES